MTGHALLDTMGVRTSLSVEDEALHLVLAGLWADCAATDAGRPIGSAVTVTGTGPWHITSPSHRAYADDVRDAVGETCAAINVSAVAATPGLAFHVAVVTRGDRCLVIPGRSGAGKTTLTAALLSVGWDYVSDEALVLDWESGRPAQPYPRPLALSPWSRSAVGLRTGVAGRDEHFVRAAELGARVRTAPPPAPTDIVLLLRASKDAGDTGDTGDAGDAGPSLVAQHRATGLAALLQRGFTLHQQPTRGIGVLTALVASSQTWALNLADPRRAAVLISDQLS